MRIELIILRGDEPEWKSMGMKRPRGYKSEAIPVRRTVWMDNIIWYEEHPDGCLVQMSEDDEPFIVANKYDSVKAEIEAAEYVDDAPEDATDPGDAEGE